MEKKSIIKDNSELSGKSEYGLSLKRKQCWENQSAVQKKSTCALTYVLQKYKSNQESNEKWK